jgi:hypothetical protein
VADITCLGGEQGRAFIDRIANPGLSGVTPSRIERIPRQQSKLGDTDEAVRHVHAEMYGYSPL